MDEAHSSVMELKQLNKLLERGFVGSEARVESRPSKAPLVCLRYAYLIRRNAGKESKGCRMPMNILGMIGVAPPGGGATVHVIGGGIDREYLRRFAQAHEHAGFDSVLVGYTSSSAEGFQVAQYAAAYTEQLNFLVAHRPGFVMPTLAARTAAHVRYADRRTAVVTHHFGYSRC